LHKNISENLELLKLILPDLLFTYFDLIKQERKDDSIHLYFEEYNDSTFIEADIKVHSKGFYQQSTVQDFPIRGNTN